MVVSGMEFSPEANSLCFTRITWGGSGRLSVGGWGFVFFLLALEATIGSFLGSARAHPYTEQSSGYNTIAPNGQIRAAKKLLEECLRFCKYLTGDCGWRNSNTDKVFLNICSTVEWVEGMPKLHIHVLRSTAAGDYNGGKIHCRIHGLFTVRAEVSRVDALKEEQHWEVLLPQRGCIHISIYTAVNLQPVQWPIVLIGVELAGWASQVDIYSYWLFLGSVGCTSCKFLT